MDIVVRSSAIESKYPWAKTAASPDSLIPHRVPFPLVRRLNQVCATAVAEALAEHDLNPQQYSALACVDDFPGIDQRRLAAMMGVDRTNVGQILEQVEAKGFVERRISSADRRARELHLTRSGHNKRQHVRPKLLAAQARVLAPLNEREREQFIGFLVTLVEANEAMARPGAGRRRPRRSTAMANGGRDASGRTRTEIPRNRAPAR